MNQTETPNRDITQIAREVDDSLALVSELEESPRKIALALKESLEALYREALTEIVRAMKADPAAKDVLFSLVDVPSVNMALTLVGILKPSIAARALAVIEGFKSYLDANGAQAELVSVDGQVVTIRFIGPTTGCSDASTGLFEDVANALRTSIPEVTDVKSLPTDNTTQPISFGPRRRGQWITGPLVDEVTHRQITRFDAGSKRFIIANYRGSFACFKNECAHQGNELDSATIDDDCVLTCPWHGFRFDALTGDCISAPGVQLTQYPIQISDGRVLIRATPK